MDVPCIRDTNYSILTRRERFNKEDEEEET